MEFKVGDYIRLERSPYLNGHFYMRLKKNATDETIDKIINESKKNMEHIENIKNSDNKENIKNSDDKENMEIITLGFGYDEPFHDKNVFLSNDIIANIRIMATSIVPVYDKWIVYHNDHPRNVKYLPNTFHILTNWIALSEKSCYIINNLINNDLQKVSFLFKLPFSSTSKENISNNCRSLILEIIKDSVTNSNVLNNYFHGNPFNNDLVNGCLIFNSIDGNIQKTRSHPCLYLESSFCCQHVKKSENIFVKRNPVVLI